MSNVLLPVHRLLTNSKASFPAIVVSKCRSERGYIFKTKFEPVSSKMFPRLKMLTTWESERLYRPALLAHILFSLLSSSFPSISRPCLPFHDHRSSPLSPLRDPRYQPLTSQQQSRRVAAGETKTATPRHHPGLGLQFSSI